MPTTQVQFRRGNTAQNLAFTGAVGEVTVDTGNYTMRVHDAVTPGGYETITVNSTQTLTNKTLNAPTINSPTITGNISGGANLIYGTSLISISGNITAGNLSVTGNVTGTVSAIGAVSATGNITGNYILGNGALLTGVITSVANINNGTSNVTVVSSGGNVTIGVAGTSNVAVFSSTGLAVTGSITQNNVPTTTRATAMSLIYGG